MPPRVLLLDIAGPVEVLRKANLEQSALRFSVSYVGATPQVESSIGLGLVGIAPLPATVPPGAWIIVPGEASQPLGQDWTGDDHPQGEAAIVTWLAQVMRPGLRLITICSGALLAGRAGLLDGHDCTTHHGTVAELRCAAPLARVLENRLFVESGGRWTSAGITSGIDLMLHLVGEVAGHVTALAVARFLVVYLRRSGADPQISPWLEGRNHLHPAIHRAQDAIMSDPARSWSVAVLAGLAATSPRHLSRLFNEQTGMSVTDYVNRMRVTLARELLTGSRLDMEHVADRAGFASPRQMRRVWRRFHPLPPSQLRTAQ